MSKDTLSVSVWRSATGAFQAFEVPARESQTVLDVVSWIQQEADSTLAYRFACRVGMCGSCAMVVNGRPRWTCRTHVDAVAEGGAIRVEPLRNLPVIRDLVTDMDPFFEKWVEAEGAHRPTATRHDDFAPIRPDDPLRRAADAAIECINCAVCWSACDVVAANPDYLGPAALNRAWTLENDPRDGSDTRLKAVSGGGGCHNCHSHQSCMEHCPNGLNPTASIAGLKRRSAFSLLGLLR